MKKFKTLLATTRNAIKSASYFTDEQYKSVSKEKVDAVVIGAGVVGIAIARELAVNHGREVIVLESASTFGTGTSSRNSEVIHAGIYYPPNSLKIGKLIVATGPSEVPKLNTLMTRGIENGVEGLKLMEGHEATRMEPELQCLKALLSPASGIVDTHSLMLSMMGEAESHGTTFSYNTTVIGGHCDKDGIQLHISESKAIKNHDGRSLLQPDVILIPRLLVNSAGLGAPALSKRFNGLDVEVIPTPYFARGCYFVLSNSKTPFQHLIYPIPEDGGLGVHVTLDLNGQVKFGPDVEWINGIDDFSSFLNMFDYSVPGERAKLFYPEIRRYYPGLKDGSLEPGYAGIRPKVSGPNQVPCDFIIQGEDIHGVPGLVNLFGIESPGLTSSMAIAEHVAARLNSEN
ncbi:L-2-hydroxyglutarate dehydrogenase, mitochondrial isoform X2 [Olea europaea var. sylvestris]|uniref:L-2-hydroxyglutarate dehydrogenase, mitochondrial isoform X2 n=1 Tax=Olea europaea var. sylvestris TaxID=158386 RepID=UPI000C1D3942|nr:L-2-hydroxyglutarate dehydrogenase, mitochondrial isoform X2 [Olea europaea var. sylvestris]